MTSWMTVLLLSASLGAEAANPIDAELQKQTQKTIDEAIAFYRGIQLEDGGFASGELGAPITGIAIAGMLKTERIQPSDPMIARGLEYLEKFIHEDGGIYASDSRKNYPTAICVLAFVEANENNRYQSVIDNAVAFLKAEQWDEGEGIDLDNPKYGGAGYGSKSRPDMSNTAFLLDALDAAGLPKDDPAYKRALIFVTRCQNYTGEGGNDLPQAAKVDDGGFYYTAAEDYNPGGGEVATGLRSYGSMTYAGLKSFIHAGLSKDDPRVQAAFNWIKDHYTLEENPGLGQQGLYYYYHTFSKALVALELDTLTDDKGKEHNWRNDLLKELVDRQQSNGSWINETPRWLENDPALVTGYVLLAIGNAIDNEK